MCIDYLTSGDTEEPLVQAGLGAGIVLASEFMSVSCLGTTGVKRYACYGVRGHFLYKKLSLKLLLEVFKLFFLIFTLVLFK